MTLIASLCINNYPLLIGDLVISGPEGKKIISIPTGGNNRDIFPAGSGWSIINLRQKVNIIDDHLMVAWAGDLASALSLIKEIANCNTNQRFTKDSIWLFLQQKYEEAESHLENTVVFVHIIDSGNHYHFVKRKSCHFNSDVESKPPFSRIQASGSGCTDFSEWLQKYCFQGTKRTVNNITEDIYGYSLSLNHFLIYKEVYKPNDILVCGYGGFYEIAICENGKLAKIDDILYLFWEVNTNETGIESIKLLSPGFKITYWNSILIIFRIEFQDREEKINKYSTYSWKLVNNLEGHMVLPLYKDKTPSLEKEIEKFIKHDFKFSPGKTISNCLMIANKKNQKESGNLMFKYLKNVSSNSIRFTWKDKVFCVEVEAIFIEELIENINF